MAYKILIVDDDPDQVEMLKMVLQTNGYEVFTAYDGKSGIQSALKSKPDLILLDVMMQTDTEGFDTAIELHSRPETKDIPIIFQTSLSQWEDYMQASLQANPDKPWPIHKFLDKPTLPNKLLSAVREILK